MESNQGSAEWLRERSGHVTCSRLKDVMAKVKQGEAAGRRNYRIALITERLTGEPLETYTNAAMAWGTQQEPYARMAYEVETGAFVEEAGFIKHPTIPWVGGSPDGLIGEDGLIEIKCPYVSSVHVETILSGEMPSDHYQQVQGLMWVTGRCWVDFCSFDPRMPEHLRLFMTRIDRDDDYIKSMEAEAHRFLSEIEAQIKKLDSLKIVASAA